LRLISHIFLYYNVGMTKKRGRPRGTSGKAKTGLLQLRVDTLEKQGFVQAAELAGIGISAWARERLRQVCRRELEEHGYAVPFLSGTVVHSGEQGLRSRSARKPNPSASS
jgi:hypothetical protein